MKSGFSVAAVIPARFASRRLPGKPLIDLDGVPMIRRVYERVMKARLVDGVIVATDDERIAESVISAGGDAILTDPDLQSGSDRVAAAAADIKADIIVNVQGDEPLIPPEMIDETVSGLIDTEDAGVATPARLITDFGDITNPNCVKVVADKSGRALYFSRSPVPYVRGVADISLWTRAYPFMRHFGLYVYRRSVLERFVTWQKTALEEAEQLEQLRLIENGVWIQIVKTEYESIAVDTAEDAERVRGILKNSTQIREK